MQLSLIHTQQPSSFEPLAIAQRDKYYHSVLEFLNEVNALKLPFNFPNQSQFVLQTFARTCRKSYPIAQVKMRLIQSRSRIQLKLQRQTKLPCKAADRAVRRAKQAVCKQTIFRDRRVPLRLYCETKQTAELTCTPV